MNVGSNVRAEIGRICAELLGLSDVPREENLFDLGFSSVLVIQLRRRILLDYRVRIPLAAFFEQMPSVASVSDEVETLLALQAHLSPSSRLGHPHE